MFNKGKTAAKGVHARVERIVLKNAQSNVPPEVNIYHPTTVKWSGERGWGPVDISPHSFFFLDVFWSKSERVVDVIDHNAARYREIDNTLLREIIEKTIQPTGEVYWNVWVDLSYNRGIPDRYVFQGNIAISFIVNADNANPLSFEALIDWSYDTYNSPSVRIREGEKYLDND